MLDLNPHLLCGKEKRKQCGTLASFNCGGTERWYRAERSATRRFASMNPGDRVALFTGRFVSSYHDPGNRFWVLGIEGKQIRFTKKLGAFRLPALVIALAAN